MVEKDLDHHQKEDQTHKVLQFPQRKDQQKDNQEAYFSGIIDGEGWISYEKASKPKSDYRIPTIGVEMTVPLEKKPCNFLITSSSVISTPMQGIL